MNKINRVIYLIIHRPNNKKIYWICLRLCYGFRQSIESYRRFEEKKKVRKIILCGCGNDQIQKSFNLQWNHAVRIINCVHMVKRTWHAHFARNFIKKMQLTWKIAWVPQWWIVCNRTWHDKSPSPITSIWRIQNRF